MNNGQKFLDLKKNQITVIMTILTIILSIILINFGSKHQNKINLHHNIIETQGLTKMALNNLYVNNNKNNDLIDSINFNNVIASLKMLQNFQNVIIIDTDNNEILKYKDFKYNFSELKNKKIFVSEKNKYIQILEPIYVNNTVSKYLIVQYSINIHYESVNDFLKFYFFIIFICILLGITGSLLINLNLIKPLEKLKKVFSEISELNLEKRVEIKGNNEFSNLAKSFNMMVDRLETAYKDISTINKNLENSINERTLKLRDEISDRKRVYNDLVNTNEFITSIIKSSPLPILTLNFDGKVLSASPSYYQLVQTNPNTLYLDSIPFLNEEEEINFINALKEIIEHEKASVHIFKLLVNSKIKIINGFFSIFSANTGESNRIIAIFDDNTEKIEKDIALIESEEKYRNLVSNAKVGIGIFHNNVKSFANDYLLDLLSINNLDEFNNTNLEEMIPQEFLPNYYEIMDFNTVNPTPYDLAIKNKKGEIIYVEITKSMVYLNDINYLQLAFINVTERVKYSKELKKLNIELEQRVIERTLELNRTLLNLQNEVEIRLEAEKQLRLSDRILQRVATIVLVANNKAEIIYANPYIENILGYKVEEIINNGWWEKIYKDENIINEEKNQIIKSTNDNILYRNEVYEKPIETKDGRTKWIQWQEVLGDNNTIIAVGNDITNQVIAKDKLKEASDELKNSLEKEKELGDLKMRFVSMISHEYRTPLTIILSSATIISKLIERKEYSKIDEFLNKIDSSVHNMVKLLEDVLSIGKEQTGDIKNQLYYINLELLIKVMIDDIKSSNNYKNEIEFSINGDFKELYTDEKLIRQILMNLITNAFKYSPNGKQIFISLIDKKDNYQIIVKDNGIGIPESDLNNLFDSFFRASNVNTISGTGLGMPIVKRAVTSLNGKISVNSKLNEGSEFIVELPYLDDNIF